jgi:ankyrin repeat protein
MEEHLWKAAKEGNEAELRRILTEENHALKGELGEAILHKACSNGYDNLVSLLLAHPDIDVNQKKKENGATPLLVACAWGKPSCALLLLRDTRVNVNERDGEGNTPLRWAALNGHLDVAKVWIASRRDMELGEPGEEGTDAVGAAEKKGNWEVVQLLQWFQDNPELVREEARRDLGIVGLD